MGAAVTRLITKRRETTKGAGGVGLLLHHLADRHLHLSQNRRVVLARTRQGAYRHDLGDDRLRHALGKGEIELEHPALVPERARVHGPGCGEDLDEKLTQR